MFNPIFYYILISIFISSKILIFLHNYFLYLYISSMFNQIISYIFIFTFVCS
ncbi:hypothetical protein H8356DRAFT_1662615, partial [Neocallimastix lanati (nom. inval.)]